MSDKELKSVLDKLNKNIEELTRSMGGGRGSTGGKSADDATKGLNKTIKSYEQALEDMVRTSTKINTDLGKAFKDFNKQFQDIGKISRDTAGGLDEINALYKKQSRFLKDAIDSDRLSNSAQDALLKKLKSVTAQFDSIGGSVAKNIKNMSQMSDVLEKNTDTLVELNDVMKKNVDVTYDNVESIEDNIDALKGLQKQNKLTTKVAKDLSDSQDKLTSLVNEHRKKLKDLGAATDAQLVSNQDIVKAYRQHMETVKGSAQLSEEAEKELSLFIAGLNDANDGIKHAVKEEIGEREKLVKSVHGVTSSFVETEKVFGPFRQGMKQIVDEAKSSVAKYMGIGAGLSMILAGVKQLYGDFVKVASAGLARNFAKIAGDSFKLGVSIESLTDIIKSNYTTYAQMGIDGFDQVLQDNQKSLVGLTGSMEEAAKTAASMADNARLFGVDVNNRSALNKSINEQTESFEILSRITGETIKQQSDQFKQMIQTENIGNSLMGLSKQERQARITSLLEQKKSLTLAGLTNEQTQKALDFQAQKAGMSLSDRMGGAAKLGIYAKMQGMDSSKANRLSELSKIITPLSADQRAEKDALLKELADKESATQRTNEAANGGKGNAALEVNRILKESLITSNAFGTGETSRGHDLSRADAEDRKITPEKQAALVAQGKLTNKETEVVSFIDFLKNSWSTGLGKVLFGMAATLITIAGAVVKMAASSTFGGFGKGIGAAKGAMAAGPGAFMGPPKQGMFAGAARSAGGALSSGASAVGNTLMKIPGADKAAGVLGKVGGAVSSGASAVGGAASKAGGFVGKMASGAGSMIGGAAKGIGKIGLKAIPFVGWAMAGMEAISGAFEGIQQASTIFAGKVGAEGLSTSQKISAGLGGALHALSFGLLPTADTAQVLDSLFTGVKDLFSKTIQSGIDWFSIDLPDALESFFNEGMPKIWENVKIGIGWLMTSMFDLVQGLFDPKNWEKAGSWLMDIGGFFIDAGSFIIKAIMKGVGKLVVDMVESSSILKSAIGDTDMFKSMKDFSSQETTFGDPVARAQAKKERDARVAASAAPGGPDNQSYIQKGVTAAGNTGQAVVGAVVPPASPQFSRGTSSSSSSVSSPSSAPASSGAPKAVGKPVGKAAGNKAALEAQMAKAGMTDPKERAAFMAQMDHESGGFKYMNELASGKAYEGRKDLGNTAEGDGVKYKGRGFIQLTGKANYKKYGDMLGIDLVSNPDMAADPAIASQIATAYWNDRKIGGKTLSEQAKAGNFDMVTKGINGGTNGKADRDQKYAAYLAEANGGAPVPAPTGNTVMPSSPKAATTAMGVTPATATALSPTNPSGYTYSAKTSTTGPSSSTSSAGTDSKRVVDLLSQIADNTAPIKDAFGSLKSDGGAPGSAGKLPTKRAAGIKNDLKSQETIKTGNLSSNSNSDW